MYHCYCLPDLFIEVVSTNSPGTVNQKHKLHLFVLCMSELLHVPFEDVPQCFHLGLLVV